MGVDRTGRGSSVLEEERMEEEQNAAGLDKILSYGDHREFRRDACLRFQNLVGLLNISTRSLLVVEAGNA